MEGVRLTLGIITFVFAILVLCSVISGVVLAIWILIAFGSNFLMNLFEEML